MEFNYTHQNEIDGNVSQSGSAERRPVGGAGCLLLMVMLPHGPKAPRNARNDLSVTQQIGLTYFGVYLLLVFSGSFLADAVM